VTTTSLEIRRTREGDLPAVLTLLRDSLGWADDARHEELFAWKHHANPFGTSPAWVALDGERIVGLRILMRWEFERAGEILLAVRAVDTATHPDYRGHGVFTRLTRRALDELRSEGTGFVFNTPNDQSRPGYQKMGWRVVGRLPIVARPTSLVGGTVHMLRARAPAERWSATTTAGSPAGDVLDQQDALARLLASRPDTGRLRTRVTPEYLRWRFASPVLEYRAMVAPDGLERGVALFRVRRRGPAREAALCDVIVPGGDGRTHRELVRRVAHVIDAHYLVAVERRLLAPGGLVRLPRQGPILTWRALAQTEMPPRRDWDLRLGDVELF
jgi:GNAT superfamily N-acetyltransferase